MKDHLVYRGSALHILPVESGIALIWISERALVSLMEKENRMQKGTGDFATGQVR
jgi:hypothetical protein